MIPQVCREAHDTVDGVFSNLGGLLHAMWSLAHESSAIDHSKPDARAIMALIDAAEAAVKAGEAGQSQAWEALREAFGYGRTPA